jgi:hypothetical protein
MGRLEATRAWRLAALIVLIAGCGLGPAWAQAVETIEVAISQPQDDAEENHLGEVSLHEGTLDLGGAYRIAGLRFTGVPLPANAQITRAYIELTADKIDPISTSLTIRGQGGDNAPAFSTAAFDLSSRPTYVTTVTWTIDYPWSTPGQVHQSPELKEIVQKIVSRPGWQSGNAMVFLLSNTENVFRRAKAYDAGPASAAKLHIEYADSVIDVPIAASTDDMYQEGIYGTVYNGSDFKISGSSGTYSGLRFANVNIPKGSLIKKAEVRFKAAQDHPAETGTVSIHAHTGTDRATFNTSPYLSVQVRSGKAPRTAFQQWSNFPALKAGQSFATDDISAIIQPVVGATTWDAYKSVLLYFTKGSAAVTRRAYAFDNAANPAFAPVLHLEYTPPQSSGGASTAVPAADKTLVHRLAFEGRSAERQTFTITNNGSKDYTYTIAQQTYSGFIPGTSLPSWYSIMPAETGGVLGPGEAKTFTVNYTTEGLGIGLYEASLSFKDSNAVPTHLGVNLKLEVVENTVDCGDTPLYTRTVSDPAVLVLLDLSDSMNDKIDLLGADDPNARTPDIKAVVQEIVNRDGWQSGNAMAFMLEKTSGSGVRWPRAFDGYNPSAARLHIEYHDGSGPKSLDARIRQSSDDIDARSGGVFFDGAELKMADKGNGWGVGLRFEGIAIPKGAAVSSAFIQMVPAQSDSGSLNLVIYGHSHDNAPTFSNLVNGGALLGRAKTAASVSWSVPAWTGVVTARKIDVAKTVIKEMVKDKAIAWGFGTWASVPPYDQLPLIESDPQTYTLVHVGCKPHSSEQESRLIAAIDAVDAYSDPLSHTPFSPSLVGANQYFNGQKKDDFPAGPPYQDGAIFEKNDCQPRFAVIVTDGKGDVDSTVENVRARTYDLARRQVSVVGVGFGVAPSEASQLFALAEQANQDGNSSDYDAIFAMHPLDSQGKAMPYLATAKNDLIDAFREILGKVKGASFTGSAPAATTSTELGKIALVTSFNAADWTGDLKAVKKSAAGGWNTVLWSAAAAMPSNRSLWTLNASGQLVPYTQTTLDGDNYLCKTLGDIVNSTPMVVGAPPYFYHFDDYKSFKLERSVTKPRDPMVYVAANDGMLHAFNLSTGVEKWAFLAPNVHAKLKRAAASPSHDMCSSTYCYESLFDGSPQAADVYGRFNGPNAPKSWRTILVVGQRAGGNTYYAFDVTSGNSFDQNPDPARLLWQHRVGPGDGEGDDGTSISKGTETWAEASIDRVDDGRRYWNGSPRGDGPVWGVFFTSGYPVDDDDQSVMTALYGVEAETGEGLWDVSGEPWYNYGTDADALWRTDRIGIGGLRSGYITQGSFAAGERITGLTSNATGIVTACNGYTIELKNVEGNFCFGETLKGDRGGSGSMTQLVLHKVGGGVPASAHRDALNAPLVVDLDVDQKADQIYVGNMYGTLYRVKNIGKGLHPHVSKLFEFDPLPAGPDVNPIRGKATFAWSEVNGNIWVYWGTGIYEQFQDRFSSHPQYVFGVKDALNVAAGDSPPARPYRLSDLVPLQSEVTRVRFNGATRQLKMVTGENPDSRPWVLKLEAFPPYTSERMFTKPLAVGGILFFTTFTPDPNTCAGTGDVFLYALDYKTGLAPAEPVFDLNGDGLLTDADKVEVNGVKVAPAGIYIGRGKPSHPVLHQNTIFITTATAHFDGIGFQPEDRNLTGLHTIEVDLRQNRTRLESWRQADGTNP